MITIEETWVSGFDAAIRGMRNPLNSWGKSDSSPEWSDTFGIGPDDMRLMRRLVRSGTDHGKFLRMITVTCDITAPLYWWKEFDTYKVGTVANSCSTMHTIHAKPFDIGDFSTDGMPKGQRLIMRSIVDQLEALRKSFNERGDRAAWRSMIQLLPESYNQRRTVQANYGVLLSMYEARRAHKLTEWHTFCDWVRELPYFAEITEI